MVTIESAITGAALILLSALLVSGLATLAAYISVVDAAGAGARAVAIGLEPEGVTWTEADGWVTVTARKRAPLRTVEATATFPREY